MSKFEVEQQYQLYLKKMKLDESKMHTVQKIETKRAFFGAFGQLLILLRDDITELPDEEAFKTLDNMINQVSQYFISETHKQN